MQKAPSVFLRRTCPATHDAKYTFRGCNYKTMPRRMGLRDRQPLPTAACWEGRARSHPLTADKPPPIPKNGEQKLTPFISHLFYSLSFGLKEQFIPPFFCFTSGFVRVPQSPSQHNGRVWNPGEELDCLCTEWNWNLAQPANTDSLGPSQCFEFTWNK